MQTIEPPTHDSATDYVVACEGPPLDYTTWVNLERAGIRVLADRPFLRLQLAASDAEQALARVNRVLARRPYIGFEIASESGRG